MIRLLLLLPVGLILARMTVEWLWFGQFDWQDVLVTRWVLQATGGAAAVIATRREREPFSAAGGSVLPCC